MIETTNILTGALSQAIETMAFLDILPLDEELAVPEKVILSQISYMGPENGTLEILAGRDFAAIVAENMGALDDVDDEACLDAMRELANVTCGLLLPMIATELSDVFDMTVPVVKSDSDVPQWDGFVSEQDCLVLNVEDHMVAIKLITND